MTRRRAALVVAAAAWAGGCGGGAGETPAIEGEVAIRVAAGASEVEFGKTFPLTVVRAWEKSLVPDSWSDRALAPLVVRLESSERTETARHVVETLRYAAAAFERESVTVEGPVLVARPPGGGREREARGEPITIAVRSALGGAAAPGPPELPGDLLEEPFRWLAPALGAGLASLAATLFLVVRARRKPAAGAPPPAPKGDAARDRALERLARLRGEAARTREATRALYLEAAALLRDYVTESHGIDATAMTREEIAAAPALAAALGAARRERCAACVAACDSVVFARHAPGDGERGAFLDSVAAFVEEG